MQDLVSVTGMVLRCEPVGEYDRRVIILTKERGKISCFAKGARKPNNRFMASTNPFSFGEFKLFEGRSSYSLNEAIIGNYFEQLRDDFEGACYGMYFLEVMDYFTRENNDEKEFLKLLYQSVRALISPKYDNVLVKSVFEIKAICINGEYPGMPERECPYDESTEFTVNYIAGSSIEKLYTFAVSKSVLDDLKDISGYLVRRFTDKPFKSLEMINLL